MNQKKRQIMGLLISISLLLSFCMGTSARASALDQLRQGAESFGEGKEEQEYFTPDEGASEVLQNQIDAYTAERENPVPMDTEEAESIVDDASDEEIVDPSGVFTIASENDVYRAFQKMVDDSKTVYAYELSGGFTLNFDILLEALTDVERADPIDSICIASYGYADNGISGHLVLDYDVPLNQLRSMKQETRTLVQEAVGDLNYLRGQTDIKIIYEVNEYICNKVTYPNEDFAAYPQWGYAPESHTAWSALKYGSAVCDGYARTCKLILNEFNIKCEMVYGNVGLDPNYGGHAWNLVNVDNAWYHMDVCWNDGSYQRQDYFLITDNMLRGDRLWDASVYPSTASTPYDYQDKI